MDATDVDYQRDFVTRQYASLIAGGLNDESARARLGEVLGKTAVDHLGAHGPDAHRADGEDTATRLADAATGMGGSAAATRAAFIHSLGEARLFALDWWRPIRTFLLYIVLLLAIAVVIAAIYAAWVLPAFGNLDHVLGVRSGAANWILGAGAVRVFAPLVAIAILLVLLAMLWFRMRLRMAKLRPLAGLSRFPWLYGRSGTTYQALLCLEYASTLRAGGVADAAVLEPALRLAGWPPEKPFQTRNNPLGEELDQAQRLGTFDAELEWQRRLHWSHAQSQLELSRDRLILFSRVLFYILIGILVTVLYIPIFSVASLFGANI